MKIERGNFQVVRACCIDGNCFECRAVFVKTRRKRIVQLDRLSKKTAEAVAQNWANYDAVVEPMKGGGA